VRPVSDAFLLTGHGGVGGVARAARGAGLLLVAANVDTARRSRGVVHLTRSAALAVNEVVGTIAVAALVVVPWALGGLHPTREDLTGRGSSSPSAAAS
jgi:hypothetical protein